MEIGWELLLILFAVAALAGWIDTLAGGGGLIVLPALLVAGVPPVQALATNKCQGFVGTCTATVTLLVKKRLPTKGLWKLMALSGIGSVIGTLLIQQVDTGWLRWAVPVLLLAVAIYFLLTPKLGETEQPAKTSEATWRRFAVPFFGFYDGFFGPGTGSFFAASRVLMRGAPLVQATVLAKPLNFTSNIASLVVFAFGGQVLWLVGGVMMLGQVIGAYFGTHAIYWGGAKLIRPLVIVMCTAMSLHQLWGLL